MLTQTDKDNINAAAKAVEDAAKALAELQKEDSGIVKTLLNYINSHSVRIMLMPEEDNNSVTFSDPQKILNGVYNKLIELDK